MTLRWPWQRRDRQRGVTLIELMISITLGLIIIAVVLQIYLASRHSNRVLDSVTLRQEALRFVQYTLNREFRMVAYRGCLRDTGILRNTLNTPNAFLYNFGQHVQGFEANGANWAPNLDATLTPVVTGTDVLTIRRIFDPGVYIRQPMPTTSAALFVQQNLNPAPFATGGGDIVLITDCGGAAVFQITQYTPASGAIVHNAGTGGGLPTPGNSTTNLGRRFQAGAEILRIDTVSYFIRQDADGTPGLWRRIGQQVAQELVEGVEDMQLQYGEDTDGDNIPDAYNAANAVTNWANITTIRVALLAVALGEAETEADTRTFNLLGKVVGPFADRRLRRVVTFTVSLRNRLP